MPKPKKIDMKRIKGVKVFSSTMAKDREAMGDVMTNWIGHMAKTNKNFEILDVVISQSSDSEFHCLSATYFYHC